MHGMSSASSVFAIFLAAAFPFSATHHRHILGQEKGTVRIRAGHDRILASQHRIHHNWIEVLAAEVFAAVHRS